MFPHNLEETLTVFGERGTVKLGGKSVNTIEVWEFADGKDTMEDISREFTENPPDIYGFGHTPLYKNLASAIVNKHDSYITAKDGKNAMELVLAIYQSSAAGNYVSLPLREGSALDFTGGEAHVKTVI